MDGKPQCVHARVLESVETPDLGSWRRKFRSYDSDSHGKGLSPPGHGPLEAQLSCNLAAATVPIRFRGNQYSCEGNALGITL